MARRRTSRAATALAGGLAASLWWTAPAAASSPDDPAGEPDAVALLLDQAGHPVGSARFTVEHGPPTVRVEVFANGLEPGRHGTHVHAGAECAPGPGPDGATIPFGAAAGHYDPDGTGNHDRPEAPRTVGHAGDLPNLDVADDGEGTLTFRTEDLLGDDGGLAVIGRTLVVHSGEDDYRSDPAGASGTRVACGVITAAADSDDDDTDDDTEGDTDGDGDGAPAVVPGSIVARYELPGGQTFPEGIAADGDGTAYVGSTTDGTIHRIDLDAGRTDVLVEGGEDRLTSAVGMALDGHGRLLVAGGATGRVAVFDVDRCAPSPAVIFATPEAEATFLNDITVDADGHAYVTDSQRPVLFRLRTSADTIGPLEPWLDFTGTPLTYTDGFNLNGIVAAPTGGYLLTVQGNTGTLWRIDTATKEVSEVDLGGASLPSGDGLLFTGDGSLWVARNSASTLVRLAVAPDGRSATVTDELVNEELLFPTTLAEADGDLLVVNGQLNRRGGDPAPVLPFTVARVAVD